jgi:hypothetical protein
MAERLRRDHGLHHESANIFSIPAARLGAARSGSYEVKKETA